MIKNLIIVITLFIITISTSSAQSTNVWYFGFGKGLKLDFNTSPPTLTNNYDPMQSEEGTTSICDASGNPLIYTNGLDIYDASTNTKFNTSTMLGGSSSTQSATIIPKPGATNTWLVFTSNTDPGTGTPGGMNYYTVTGTAGSYSLSAATNLASSTAVGEGLCIIGSTKAGTQYWVVIRERGSANIRAYPISTTGVVGAAVVSSAGGLTFNNYIGTVKSNICQNQVAFTYYDVSKVELYNFDASTGQATSLVTTLSIPHAYGIEFSPNDQYLYITQLDAPGQLHQYNISGASDYAPASWSRTGEIGQLQLGPDGKIYVALTGGGSSAEYIGAINSPNSATSSANFVFNAIQVNTVPATDGYCYRGLPTFPKSLVVSTPEISPADTTICQNASINFKYSFAGSVSSVSWDFGNPGSGASNTSTSSTPSHTYNSTGTYTVTLTVTDNCSRNWTATTSVSVVSPKTPTGTVSCVSNSVVLTATGSPSSDYPNYVWYDNNGKVVGIGSPMTLNYDATHAPGSFTMQVASSASTTSSGSNSIGPPASNLTWVGNTPSGYAASGINVLSDVLTLKSFQIKPYNLGGTNCNNFTFDVEIKNSSGTVVYLNSFNSGTFTCGNSLTVNINTTLTKGSNYTLTLKNFAGNIQYIYGGSWSGATNANQITFPTAGGAGTFAIANVQYDYKNFSISPTCSNTGTATRSCTLPVEIISFNAENANGKVLLSWSTASEINNNYFDIQRSFDGESFETIGTVKGSGTTKQVNNYYFQDENINSNVVYYRLIQHDFNGNTSVSYITSITIQPSTILEAYPNPSANQFNVIVSNASKEGTITVYDIIGKEIYKKIISGSKEFIIGEEWQKGNYLLKYISDTDSKTIHLIKE